jgi:hypothetical protein
MLSRADEESSEAGGDSAATAWILPEGDENGDRLLQQGGRDDIRGVPGGGGIPGPRSYAAAHVLRCHPSAAPPTTLGLITVARCCRPAARRVVAPRRAHKIKSEQSPAAAHPPRSLLASVGGENERWSCGRGKKERRGEEKGKKKGKGKIKK